MNSFETVMPSKAKQYVAINKNGYFSGDSVDRASGPPQTYRYEQQGSPLPAQSREDDRHTRPRGRVLHHGRLLEGELRDHRRANDRIDFQESSFPRVVNGGGRSCRDDGC